MNLVNISTALHRLAKLTANSHKAQVRLRHHPVLAALLQAACAALGHVQVSRHCQALSNIAWALATLEISNPPLMEAVAELSCGWIADFKPFELSATLWAFAKLDAVRFASCESAACFFRAAAERIQAHAESFTFRCLVMTAWAFASSQQYSGSLFRSMVPHMIPMVHTANCQDIASIAWAFGTAGVRHDRLFTELVRKALKQLGDFKPQELLDMLGGFAASGFLREDLFVGAARTEPFLELRAGQVAGLLRAVSRGRARHRGARAAVLALLPRCTRMVGAFEPQELSSLVSAAGRSFGRAGGVAAGKEPARHAALPPDVTRFFLAALPVIISCPSSLSGQALADIAWSYLAVEIGGDTGLFPIIAREAARRVAELRPSALLLLLCSLPSVGNEGCRHSTLVLFEEASQRVDTMCPRELQILSCICTGLLGLRFSGVLPADDLRRACLMLSKVTAWPLREVGGADPRAWAADELNKWLLEGPCIPGNRLSVDPECSPAGVGVGIDVQPRKHSECSTESRTHPAVAMPAPREPTTGPPTNDNHTGVVASDLAARVPRRVNKTLFKGDDDGEPGSQSNDQDSVSSAELGERCMDSRSFRAGRAACTEGARLTGTRPAAPLPAEMTEEGFGARRSQGFSARQLPPPLDCVARVSLDRSETYRTDYQRLGAGYACGAREGALAGLAEESPEFEDWRFRAGDPAGAGGRAADAVAHDEPDFIALDELAAYTAHGQTTWRGW